MLLVTRGCSRAMFLLWIWRREAVGGKVWRVEELGTTLAMEGPHVTQIGSLGLEGASFPVQLQCAMLQRGAGGRGEAVVSWGYIQGGIQVLPWPRVPVLALQPQRFLPPQHKSWKINGQKAVPAPCHQLRVTSSWRGEVVGSCQSSGCWGLARAPSGGWCCPGDWSCLRVWGGCGTAGAILGCPQLPGHAGPRRPGRCSGAPGAEAAADAPPLREAGKDSGWGFAERVSRARPARGSCQGRAPRRGEAAAHPPRPAGAMRCSLKRSLTVLLAASFLLLLLLLHGGSRQEQDLLEVELRGMAPDRILQLLQPEGAQRILRDTAELSALRNVSYQLLAGSPAPRKKFLAVGLASVQRPRGFYLPATLQSLFSQSTEEELQEMVVVVHLADPDPGWNVRVATTIAQKFARHILLGRLLLIHAPAEFYPTLEGLKRNFNDAEERVRFRSKQNVDYAFLLAFAANLSSYYLMIEDDVWSARSFLTAIRRALATQEGSNWATLEFSKLGYIGKLYRSSDLPRLARFLLLFYQEMPCDWLLVHFRQLLTQKDVIRFKPSLFQHMGLYSSFQGTVNRLEDEDFQADALDLPDNPPASLYTSMSIFENYAPLKAYSSAQGYFWGKDPAAGSTFSIVFRQPARVSRVRVRTGSVERPGDFLRAGLLELGRHRDRGRDCSSYVPVGSFKKGTLEQQGLETVLPGPVECVRIRVTQDQSEWLIIQSIDIWTTAGT